MIKIKQLTTAIILGHWLIATPSAVARTELAITEARWEGEGHLVVRGTASSRTSEVQLINGNTNSTIARIEPEDDGKWKYETERLTSEPCTVKAVAGRRSAESDVSGACQSASSEQTSTQTVTAEQTSTELSITEALWESGGHLVVKGTAPRRTSEVRLINGTTDSTLAKIQPQRDGSWTYEREGLRTEPCTVKAVVRRSSVESAVDGACQSEPPPSSGGGGDTGGGTGGGTGGTTLSGDYVTLAINDLGMHCADLDYSIFSILPPFNVVHSQVIRKGTSNTPPRIMGQNEVDVYYTASPTGWNTSSGFIQSLTASGQMVLSSGTFDKSNFWGDSPNGGLVGANAYNPLYHGKVNLNAEGVLPADKGLPAPMLELLYPNGSTTPDFDALAATQQMMPGPSNTPQKFNGYIETLPFFAQFPFGYQAEDLQRHTAEGIPILPITDDGYINPYPLMSVSAVAEGATPTETNQLSSVRVTLPVASEADCQSCHVTQTICDTASDEREMSCTGIAAEKNKLILSTDEYNRFTPLLVEADLFNVPGNTLVERVLNASKINILRLHDAKEGTDLDQQREVVCATCHYSPALDLAHVGPNDDAGKEQTQHDSMSRVMHGYHASIRTDYSQQREVDLFPDMPQPDPVTDYIDPDTSAFIRGNVQVANVLQESCYNCHPGKQTKCLRGAMAKGGVVCQDCHGNLAEVGDDFSQSAIVAGTPAVPGMDPSDHFSSTGKRVPWASEPGCQSCHTGSATNNLASDPHVIPASDGIRLLQAYRTNDTSAMPILAMNRLFAENQGPSSTNPSETNQHLYRLSKGHGGVMCEGCHGSTHAIWPSDSQVSVNDNLNAIDLQGHAGTLVECDACHAPGSLGLTLDGPHGMHPVNDSNWTKDHKELAEHQPQNCTSCHGARGEGTVLSMTAAPRQAICKDDKGSLCSREGQRPIIPEDTEVSCTLCHGNYILND